MGKAKKKKKPGSLPFSAPSSRIPHLLYRALPTHLSHPSKTSVHSDGRASGPMLAPPGDLTSPPSKENPDSISSMTSFEARYEDSAPREAIVSSPKLAKLITHPHNLRSLVHPPLMFLVFVCVDSDDNIEEAKAEFKDFIFARFRGDIPSKGRIIGVVNAIWARSGPRIIVHKVGEGCFILKVTNARTKEILLSRPAWMIAGSPMFVAPWSSEFSHEEPH
ncbi:hypothetical protein Bca4012_085461 [Brassica carinata]